jgi:tetratricopeptide (TPR) repeat protein
MYRKHAYPADEDNRKVFLPRDSDLQDVELSQSETMVFLYREVFNHLSPQYPDRCTLLTGISHALYVGFTKTRLTDLDEAIILAREALELRPLPYRSRSLYWLTSFLWHRFRETRKLADLEEAITLQREALEQPVQPPPHRYDHPELRKNLAVFLSTRFVQTGQLADIEEAVLLGRGALEVEPPPSRGRSDSLDNLALYLSWRFEKTGQLADIEEAVHLGREALELRPVPHRYRSRTLGLLATYLSKQFDKTGNIADKEEADSMRREALKLESASSSNR